MAANIGKRIRILALDGEYEGYVAGIDNNTHRLSLKNSFEVKSGQQIKGIQHFYESDIIDVIDLSQSEKQEKKENPSLKESEKKSSRSLISRDRTPIHLVKLPDLDEANHLLKDSVTRNEEPGNETSGDKTAFSQKTFSGSAVTVPTPHQVGAAETGDLPDDGYLRDYSLLDKLDKHFVAAIEHIELERDVGLVLEGVSIGRAGTLSWILISTSHHLFVFDMISLGKAGILQGLGGILEGKGICKVTHDCRAYTDLLWHQFSIRLCNVFDTQVASVMLYRTRTRGGIPRYVDGLPTLLNDYLNIPHDVISMGKSREPHVQADQSVWTTRPLPSHLMSTLLHKVRYLRKLRYVMTEEMLRDFTEGVDIYLHQLADMQAEQLKKHENSLHLLPRDFGRFSQVNDGHAQYRQRYIGGVDENGFQENSIDQFDCKVVFSHDGIWHGKANDWNAEKMAAKKQQFNERWHQRQVADAMSRNRSATTASLVQTVSEKPASDINFEEDDRPRQVKSVFVPEMVFRAAGHEHNYFPAAGTAGRQVPERPLLDTGPEDEFALIPPTWPPARILHTRGNDSSYSSGSESEDRRAPKQKVSSRDPPQTRYGSTPMPGGIGRGQPGPASPASGDTAPVILAIPGGVDSPPHSMGRGRGLLASPPRVPAADILEKTHGPPPLGRVSRIPPSRTHGAVSPPQPARYPSVPDAEWETITRDTFTTPRSLGRGVYTTD